MTEALTRPEPRIDHPKELDRVVRRLIERFDPDAIYLFGSRARGDAGDDSDYDLMLVLADDDTQVRSRQAVWETAQSERIDVNPFVSRGGAFSWRRLEVGTLEHEVQIDGVRLHPTSGADLRAEPAATEVRAWIAEIEALKADSERWLAAREATP